MALRLSVIAYLLSCLASDLTDLRRMLNIVTRYESVLDTDKKSICYLWIILNAESFKRQGLMTDEV